MNIWGYLVMADEFDAAAKFGESKEQAKKSASYEKKEEKWSGWAAIKSLIIIAYLVGCVWVQITYLNSSENFGTPFVVGATQLIILLLLGKLINFEDISELADRMFSLFRQK